HGQKRRQPIISSFLCDTTPSQEKRRIPGGVLARASSRAFSFSPIRTYRAPTPDGAGISRRSTSPERPTFTSLPQRPASPRLANGRSSIIFHFPLTDSRLGSPCFSRGAVQIPASNRADLSDSPQS